MRLTKICGQDDFVQVSYWQDKNTLALKITYKGINTYEK